MNLISTKLMLGIASIALGASLMILTFIIAVPSVPEETAVAEKDEAVQVVVQEIEETPFLISVMQQFNGVC